MYYIYNIYYYIYNLPFELLEVAYYWEMKKISIPNPVKSLGYFKCYNSSSPRTVKSPINSIWYNCLKICSSENKKRPHFSRWSTIIFFKDFINHRKQTIRAVVFSSRPLPNNLKKMDHRWNLPTIWKTRLLQVLLEEFS